MIGTNLRKKVNWRIFFAMVSVCAIIAALLARWLHMNFWLTLVVVILGVLLNGTIAVWEDEQPVGFHEPKPDECSNIHDTAKT